jgi:flagellar FliJ protein
MKPFAFRWQRMLRLAQGFEKDRRNALATAVGQLTRAENVLGEMRRNRQELMENRSKLLSDGVLIEKVRDNYQGELATETRIDAQEKRVEQCEKRVGERREELAGRMRERKTYEKLREREWEKYSVDASREESRVVDDIAAITFERSGGEDTGGSDE